MPRLLPPLVIAGTLAGLAARPRLRNWGASPEERSRVLPGDGLVPGERGVCTMATTIGAPAAAIWPWLAQMGTDRAGWYSWDRLDNGGEPSADDLDPARRHIEEGDRLTSVPGRAWFDVVHVEPSRSLVLRAAMGLTGRSYDPAAPRPRCFIDARWEFFLEPLGDGSTRLIVRSGAAGAPRPVTALADLVLWHPAHLVMQVRQLQQLRVRAEGLTATLGSGELRHEVAAGAR